MSMPTILAAVALLVAFPAATQPPAQTAGDRAAIRATVLDYIQGYYTGDAARMQRALHPDYLKHTISGSGRVSEWTGSRMVEAARSGEGRRLPAAARREVVKVLDVTGDVAAAKLITPGWVDYMTLTRLDGRWRSLSVVLRERS